ncbi:hypothetical protein ACWDSD_44460 [Streptomyces spiralis]
MTPDSGAAPSVRHLVERSGDLKGELVAFAQSPRFARRLEAQLDDAADDGGLLDESGVVAVIDRFALEHRLADGRSLIEHFVAQRKPPLEKDERAMLLGWCDALEAVFEVDRVDGDCVVLRNLFDDLFYRVYSNMGQRALRQVRQKMFVIGRIVPVHPATDAWLVSGHLVLYPKSAARQIAQLAAETLAARPQLLRRNREKLEYAWQMQAEDRAAFIELAGDDLVILPPKEAQQLLREHHRRRQERARATDGDKAEGDAAATGPSLEELSWLPQELQDAETTGLLYDETEGLSYYADYGRLDALFADPSLTRDRSYLTLLREYLNDDSVHPVAIRRLVQRHPEGADTVFRTLLRKPSFSWERDGESLLRRRKKARYGREPLPSITVVGDRLAELLRTRR